MRESRTPGSARGGRGNPVPYRYSQSWVVSEKVYLAGQRKWSSISLESCASLATIGRAVFGHSDEPSAAGLMASLWRALGHKVRALL